MAPQLGIGSFRIIQDGTLAAYAMSNGTDKEVWALLNGTFVMPTFGGPPTDLHIEPIAPAPNPVDCNAMCAFLTTVPGGPPAYTVREHTITPCTCD